MLCLNPVKYAISDTGKCLKLLSQSNIIDLDCYDDNLVNFYRLFWKKLLVLDAFKRVCQLTLFFMILKDILKTLLIGTQEQINEIYN